MQGMLVPNSKDVLSVNISEAKWILIVEKEARMIYGLFRPLLIWVHRQLSTLLLPVASGGSP